MLFHPNGEERLNCFSLVAYIPDPLGAFLDNLRKEMVPSCVPRAHVTILPPRPLGTNVEEAARLAQELSRDFPPFEIEAAAVEIFPVTDVVYIEIGLGVRQLQRMHQAMNTGLLEYNEPFSYHPHITLAQEIQPEEAVGLTEVARRRWAAFPHPRRFPVHTLTFVQNTVFKTWVDLLECPLAAPQPVR